MRISAKRMARFRRNYSEGRRLGSAGLIPFGHPVYFEHGVHANQNRKFFTHGYLRGSVGRIRMLLNRIQKIQADLAKSYLVVYSHDREKRD